VETLDGVWRLIQDEQGRGEGTAGCGG